MRAITLVGLGVLVGMAALGAIWATVVTTTGSTSTSGIAGAVDVRIVVERLDDGRVEVGLQQRQVSGEWGETEEPRRRFLSPYAEANKPLHSSTLVIDTTSRHEQVEQSYAAYLYESGVEIAGRHNDRFALSGAEGEAPIMLCIEDLNDPGIGRICDGFDMAYEGPSERLTVSSYEDLRTELQSRIEEEPGFGGLFATSIPTAGIVDDVLEANRTWRRWSYWIELIDPHLPDPDNLYCVVSHGGEDLFWGLSSESSLAAAGALGINLRSEAYLTGAEQADGIRRCVADGAVAIATTLAEPEVLKPAIDDAMAAGVPVLSFNSGAEVAESVGTVLHISLDDREAGRLAGAELNRREIEGTVLCIIHEPNNTGLHDRCAGLEDGFNGSVERWSPSNNEDTVDELRARLQVGDINAAIGLSSGTGVQVRRASFLSQLDIPVATFGWSRTIAEYVAEGRMMFAIFDHPELQSYYAAVTTMVLERFRIDPGAYFGSAQLLIVPQIVDAADMQVLRDTLVDQETQ